ncbi:uncharacterized protein PV07_08954 [Cladophialophora immunda]|uniref:Xylanolytic transcriptional activator regulatory domain-containing protein n=1 Tax=Cladophialophora immunda TaxID=569365 RepID=A0A0D1ZDH4_9EURO|nr:uncharacterized protein PV07_08954 [Cladophialophora immunda]KIW25811.1 hypothetical protein PV07_08954 [Cladophialophora immunda]
MARGEFPASAVRPGRSNAPGPPRAIVRAPISHEYVGALEGRVAALELLLSSIKTSAAPQRSAIIDGIDFLDHLSPVPSKTQPHQESGNSLRDGPQGFWGLDEDGVAVFHAPGSAYGTGLFSCHKSKPVLPSQQPSLDNITSIPKVVLQECIALFFKWQHPFCSLVDRDVLLEDCRHQSRLSKHRPSALLHSVCALGALMSDDHNIRELADQFAASAEEAVKNKCLWRPHIATSQTMLLCAAFATGKGNVSKAWMYSGMALRMTQDLGVHESHSPLLPDHAQNALLVNLELRQRMSLTFTISDKLFSLFFGRPPMNEDHSLASELPVLDTPISSWEQTTSLADALSAPPLQQWVDQHRKSSFDDRDQSYVPTLLLIKQAELGNVIKDIQLQVHCKRKLHHLSEYYLQALYNKLNARLWSWYDSLPGDMRWSRWSSNFEEVEPSVANLHMIYHTARISLNRSLISAEVHGTSSEFSKLVFDAFEACNGSIETIVGILRRFSAQHALKNAPFSFAHGAVTAIDATLAMVSCSRKVRQPQPNIQDTCLSAIDTALAEIAHAWEMANDARRGLRQVLSSWGVSFDTNDHSKPATPQGTTTTNSPNFLYLQIADTAPNVIPSTHYMQQSLPNVLRAPPLDLELLAQTDFDAELNTMFHNPDDSDSNFWNSVMGSDNGTPSSSSSSGSQASAYVYGT